MTDSLQVDIPQADTPLGRHPPQIDGHWSGRYASYWNVFLFYTLLPHIKDKSLISRCVRIILRWLKGPLRGVNSPLVQRNGANVIKAANTSNTANGDGWQAHQC